MNGGHGHVTPRPDGQKARCGGPKICAVCALELANKAAPSPQSPAPDTVASLPGEWRERFKGGFGEPIAHQFAAELERRLQAERAATEAKESAALASLADELHRIEAEETSVQQKAATIADPLERLAYLVGEVARQGGGELAVVAVAAVDAVRSQQPTVPAEAVRAVAAEMDMLANLPSAPLNQAPAVDAWRVREWARRLADLLPGERSDKADDSQ